MSTTPDELEPTEGERLDEANDRITNLETALQTSRNIGMAVGIVMERHKLTPEDAFEMLQVISKHTNRKVRDLAADIVFTGIIPDVRT